MLCPYCGGTELVWRAIDGDGTVYSATTVRRRPDRGGDLNISLVELDGGARIFSRVDGVPPDQVHIGMRVSARLADVDGDPLVVFQPVHEQEVSS